MLHFTRPPSFLFHQILPSWVEKVINSFLIHPHLHIHTHLLLQIFCCKGMSKTGLGANLTTACSGPLSLSSGKDLSDYQFFGPRFITPCS